MSIGKAACTRPRVLPSGPPPILDNLSNVPASQREVHKHHHGDAKHLKTYGMVYEWCLSDVRSRYASCLVKFDGSEDPRDLAHKSICSLSERSSRPLFPRAFSSVSVNTLAASYQRCLVTSTEQARTKALAHLQRLKFGTWMNGGDGGVVQEPCFRESYSWSSATTFLSHNTSSKA